MQLERSTTRTRTFRCGLLLVGALLFATGCAGQGQVSGNVSYKGKSLTWGSVMIVGGDNIPHYGEIQPDGSYTVEGVPPGNALIAVTSIDPTGGDQPAREGKPRSRKRENASADGFDRSRWFPIPDKYGRLEDSGLTIQVKKGNNAHNIDLR